MRAETILGISLFGLVACPAVRDDAPPVDDSGAVTPEVGTSSDADAPSADGSGSAAQTGGDAGDTGDVDPDQGCGAPPICGEPCGNLVGPEAGCCPCWDSPCSTDAAGHPIVLECAAAIGMPGECYQPRACETECVYLDGDLGEVAVCLEEVDTCEEIAAQYAELAEALHGLGCNDAEVCSVVPGHCEVGLGGCWLPASFGGSVAALDGLAARWVDLACPPGPACDCATGAPSPVCIGDGDALGQCALP